MELKACLEDGEVASELSEPHLWFLGDGYRKGEDELGLDAKEKCPGGWNISDAVAEAKQTYLVPAEFWLPWGAKTRSTHNHATFEGSHQLPRGPKSGPMAMA